MTASNSQEVEMSHLDQNTEQTCERTRKVFEEHGYTLKEQLGCGASGRVFWVNCKEGDSYVVKEINYSNTNLDKLKNEAEILKRLKHGYIVTYKDSFEDTEVERLYIVMEYCEEDLYKKMQTQREKGFFEEEQILDWLVQICLALKYIHENCVLHRDIKPENIFLNVYGHISLGDFGYSIQLERPNQYANSVVGAQLYVSPDVFKKRYNSKSDIWSFGWVLHDLCMLDAFSDIKRRIMLHVMSMNGVPPEITERYSEELRNLITEMLSCDPKNRPSAEQILAKPFLNGVVNKNKRIPEALEKKFMETIRAFNEAYDEHHEELETFNSKLKEITKSLEEIHRKTTIGSLSGGVIGAAGGVTAVIGAILAPFTFGASLIVTIVGASVATAGGVTGAASNIIGGAKQKSLREEIQKIEPRYKKASEPILTSLYELRRVLKKMNKFCVFQSPSTFGNINMELVEDRNRAAFIAQVMHLGMLGNLGRLAAQTVKVARVAGAAVSGVLSGLFLIFDIAFVVKDSREIHEMRQLETTEDPEQFSSQVLKSIAQLKKACTDLDNFIDEIGKTRNELSKIEEQVKGSLDIDFNI